MKLKTNKNYTKGSRKKTRNQKNNDQSGKLILNNEIKKNQNFTKGQEQ
jgi:hypothetical protein